jgi:hypothetical protein
MAQESKLEINIEEVTEPQIFMPPKRMITWSYREGRPCYVCEREVVAILPKLPNHARIVCLDGNKLWWAEHCGRLSNTPNNQ